MEGKQLTGCDWYGSAVAIYGARRNIAFAIQRTYKCIPRFVFSMRIPVASIRRLFWCLFENALKREIKWFHDVERSFVIFCMKYLLIKLIGWVSFEFMYLLKSFYISYKLVVNNDNYTNLIKLEENSTKKKNKYGTLLKIIYAIAMELTRTKDSHQIHVFWGIY